MIIWKRLLIKYAIETLDAKIESVREELRQEMVAGFKDLGDKACLCRHGRQMEGHEARISTLEQHVA